jgi:signal transduction histidine kinase/DNA-binding response OmpR family regulator
MIDLHYDDELRGMHLARLCPERDLRIWLSEIIDQGSGTLEGHVQRKQGDTLLAIITATVIDRARQEIQIIIHDITEQKKIEQTLREAKEASDEANKLKSRFVFNVSHDIRTPLHGIIGFAEMVVAEKSLEKAQQHGWTILNESETLLTLINDLLDLAKIEAGKMEISPEPLDIAFFASSTVSPLINVAKNQKLELKWTLQPETPRYVEADPMRIRQILLNLIGNAIKFTEKGEIELAIGTREQENGEDQLLFTVMDTGIGIDNSKQEMIFQSFTQADATTTRRYGGTGLGTTIARELVNLMEGEIGVISIPNSGSTFWFTIPLREVPAEAVPKQAPRSRGSEPLVTKKGTILLAEDYPTNQTIATLQLTNVGHEVTVVENGEDAVAICDNRRFDLILMDIQMPHMDGQEATQRIRKSSKLNAETPILALTASAETSTRDACLHAGMNDTLVKPLRRNALLEIVERWLTRDGQAPSPLKNQTMLLDEADEAPSMDPIDWSKALEQFGENREILEKTLTKFIKQTALDLKEMRQTLEEQELETLRKQAHRLKGAAAYLAARPISSAAAELETETKAQSRELSSKALELIQHIGDELHRLEASVSQNQNH